MAENAIGIRFEDFEDFIIRQKLEHFLVKQATL